MRIPFTRKFSRAEEGSLSIEAVFALPLLVWAITATFVFWDAFKTLNVSQKATYTIADMLSREDKIIDANYLTSMHEIFDLLAGSHGDNAIRVTAITKQVNETTLNEELALVWSHGVNISGYADLALIADRIPTIAVGEQLIFVESEQEWSPAFAVGLASYRFRKVALARPRFTSKLCWEGMVGCVST